MVQSVSLLVLFALAPLAWAGPVVPVPVPEHLRNSWPAEWEKEFQARAERVLNGMCAKEKAAGLGGRTYFESEKRDYGLLMAHAMAGTKDVAIKEPQKEDVQAKEWHSQTAGIDYYACFTIKHQMRKYFLFGDKLDPAYKKRMFDGAKAWTEKDPLRRPQRHPLRRDHGLVQSRALFSHPPLAWRSPSNELLHLEHSRCHWLPRTIDRS